LDLDFDFNHDCERLFVLVEWLQPCRIGQGFIGTFPVPAIFTHETPFRDLRLYVSKMPGTASSVQEAILGDLPLFYEVKLLFLLSH
jgi:hypothetical protein